MDLDPHSPERRDAEYAATLVSIKENLLLLPHEATNQALVRTGNGHVTLEENLIPPNKRWSTQANNTRFYLKQQAAAFMDDTARAAAMYRGRIGVESQESDIILPPAPLQYQASESATYLFYDRNPPYRHRASVNHSRLTGVETFGDVFAYNANVSCDEGTIAVSLLEIKGELVLPQMRIFPSENASTYARVLPMGDQGLDSLINGNFIDEADLNSQLRAAAERLRRRLSYEDICAILTEVAAKAHKEKEILLLYAAVGGNPPIEFLKQALEALKRL